MVTIYFQHSAVTVVVYNTNVIFNVRINLILLYCQNLNTLIFLIEQNFSLVQLQSLYIQAYLCISLYRKYKEYRNYTVYSINLFHFLFLLFSQYGIRIQNHIPVIFNMFCQSLCIRVHCRSIASSTNKFVRKDGLSRGYKGARPPWPKNFFYSEKDT